MPASIQFRRRLQIVVVATLLILSTQPTATLAEGHLLLDLQIVLADGSAPVKLTATELDGLTQHIIRTHSPYYQGTVEFSGPLLVDVISSVAGHAVKGKAKVSLHALNNYSVHTTVDELRYANALLATRMEGKRLSVRERGPYWIILPLTHRKELDAERFHKLMVWQLHKISYGDEKDGS